MTRLRIAVITAVVLLGTQMASATPYSVFVNLPEIGGHDVRLEIALYDNSGSIGDSWASLDDVALGAARDDFESGTLGAFDASLNPASVNIEAGSLTGVGNFVMRIDEDPVFSPTVVQRQYLGAGSNVLNFNFELASTGTSGVMGQDELVFALWDSQSTDPLVPGLTGLGEFLAVRAGGMNYIDGVTVTPIVVPAPAAFALGLLGVGSLRLWRRQLRLR